MSVLMLAASQGTDLVVTASGPDADEALEQIEALIHDRFEETE